MPAEENLFPERWALQVKRYPGLEQFQIDFNRPFQRVTDFLPNVESRGDLLDPRPQLREASKQGSIFLKHDFHYSYWGQESVGQVLAPWIEAKMKAK